MLIIKKLIEMAVPADPLTYDVVESILEEQAKDEQHLKVEHRSTTKEQSIADDLSTIREQSIAGDDSVTEEQSTAEQEAKIDSGSTQLDWIFGKQCRQGQKEFSGISHPSCSIWPSITRALPL